MFEDYSELKKKVKYYALIVDSYLRENIRGDIPGIWDASYHYISAGGKRLRPFLVLKGYEICGGRSPDAVLPVACSYELVHTFTLIHDDMIDGDDMRRGLPSVQAKWGAPLAILSGDLLSAMAVLFAHRAPAAPEIRAEIMKKIGEVTVDLCLGQTLDVSFETKRDTNIEEYLRMIFLKTGSLFQKCAESGALLAGAGQNQFDALRNYARNLGYAFQITDDVLGLTADEKVLGKPVLSDLREGKKTYPVLMAMGMLGRAKSRALKDILNRDSIDDGDVRKAMELIQESGALEESKRVAVRYMEDAIEDISIFRESDAKRDLAGLVRLAVERDM